MEQIHDNEFKESFIKIAIPVGVQQLFFVLLTFIDSLMVGRLGQVEYNAVGLGGQFDFIIILVVVGVTSATKIYSAQYYGADDLKGFRKSLGLAVIACFTLAFIAFLLSIFFPKFIVGLFTKEEDIITVGAGYLSIIAFQMPIEALTIPISNHLHIIKKAKIPLVISIVSLSFNTVLNYILIFGKLGFEPMGVMGAGIATVISRIFALILYLVILGVIDNEIKGKVYDFINIRKEFVFKVFKTGWTVVLHELFWSLAMVTYILILSRLRTDGYTAYRIADQFQRLVMIFSMAVSATASVTIGAQLGRKDIEKALIYEKKYSKVQIIIGIICSFLVIISAYFLVDLFKISRNIKLEAFYISIALSVFIPFKTYSAMQAAGILRAGGDTKFPVIFELIGIYLMDIPILYVLLTYTNLSTPIIIFFASMGSVLNTILLYHRVKSKKWAKNLIE